MPDNVEVFEKYERSPKETTNQNPDDQNNKDWDTQLDKNIKTKE